MDSVYADICSPYINSSNPIGHKSPLSVQTISVINSSDRSDYECSIDDV